MATDDRSRAAPSPAGSALRAAGLLTLFAAVGAGVVAMTYRTTAERIEDNEKRFLLQSLHQILPAHTYDNELYRDTIMVNAPELGGDEGRSRIFRARKEGQPVAAILSVTAPDGYSGPIDLLVGIHVDGSLAGVRVTSHRETPGLGDGIEIERSDWILDFEGKSLAWPDPPGWAVRRDGGLFDQFTGATITPRAIVKAVRGALLYFRDHRDELLESEAEETG